MQIQAVYYEHKINVFGLSFKTSIQQNINVSLTLCLSLKIC